MSQKKIPALNDANTLPTMENFSRVLPDLAGLSWKEDAPRRKEIRALIQNGIDAVRSTAFALFDMDSALKWQQCRDFYDRYPILLYYDAALDKLVKEVPQERVPRGTVVIWHLYNMGYVVKTHDQCFGIDLHHRRAERLEPWLDFILLTHNHDDHCNEELLDKMLRNGKVIVSNYRQFNGYNRGPGEMTLGDIHLAMEETDHNGVLRNFMKTYLIRCGKGRNACTIYHTGDSCDPAQLNPAGPVDVFMVHPRVGLDVPTAVNKFRPRWTFFSHMQEMGHCQPCRWRPVNFRELEEYDIPAIAKAGLGSAIPLWGEKIVWTAADR